jgi:integrase
MGVHTLQRASGVTYGINFMVNGRQVHEVAGTDKRAAERLLRQRKREVANGTYVASAKSSNVSLAKYAALWLEQRNNRTCVDDAQRLRDHILPRVGSLRLSEVTQADVVKLVRDLQTGGNIGLKTAKNAYGVFRTLMRDARIEGLLAQDPCVLPRGIWREESRSEREPYSAREVISLVTDARIEWDRRVLFALWFYTGSREGEACGLKWGDWIREAQPLGSLAIDSQYEDESLKTNRPRKVPVHPELAAVLDEWWREGFELTFARRPTSADWIVPLRSESTRPHTKSSAYKAFRRACEVLDIENRSLHSTRHTMITWARRGGARPDVLEKITHNAAGRIIDQYTHWDWEPLCQAVLCLDYVGAAAARPLRVEQPTAASRPIVAAAPLGGPLRAPVYDARYDARLLEPEIIDEFGGGAGNRTLSRDLAARVIHAEWLEFARFVSGWTRLVPVGSIEKSDVAGHTRNMRRVVCGRVHSHEDVAFRGPFAPQSRAPDSCQTSRAEYRERSLPIRELDSRRSRPGPSQRRRARLEPLNRLRR